LRIFYLKFSNVFFETGLQLYQNDSFFGLSAWGQVGLVCISTGLFLFMIFTAWKLLRNRPIWLRILGALFLFWLFVWLSPQVYYMYYRMIIPDLPLQWVIKPPLNLLIVFEYLFFQGPQNMSAHSQGALGWWLIVAPFLRWANIKSVKR